MTLTTKEYAILSKVRNQLMMSNTVYVTSTQYLDIMGKWNGLGGYDSKDELAEVKFSIYCATEEAHSKCSEWELTFSEQVKEYILDKLENLGLMTMTQMEVSQVKMFEEERKALKAGEEHKMVEVVINDEVNFKMQISKGDKLTLEITDKGVIQVSLSEDRKEK